MKIVWFIGKGDNIFRCSSIFARLSTKDPFATFRAEIVVPTPVFISCRKFFIHFYSANWIDRHLSYESLLVYLFILYTMHILISVIGLRYIIYYHEFCISVDWFFRNLVTCHKKILYTRHKSVKRISLYLSFKNYYYWFSQSILT